MVTKRVKKYEKTWHITFPFSRWRYLGISTTGSLWSDSLCLSALSLWWNHSEPSNVLLLHPGRVASRPTILDTLLNNCWLQSQTSKIHLTWFHQVLLGWCLLHYRLNWMIHLPRLSNPSFFSSFGGVSILLQNQSTLVILVRDRTFDLWFDRKSCAK